MGVSNQTKCQGCGRMYSLDNSNCVIYHYICQPWFSWQKMICSHCGHGQGGYIRDNFDAEMAWAVDNDIGFITEDFPTADVIAMFIDVYDIHTLETRELTETEEKEVKFWEWLLTRHGMDGFQPETP